MMAQVVHKAPRPTPQVDLDRIRDMYSELKKMQVKLDPNPIEYGPKRFNTRIARVRAMLNRVDQIFLQTSEDLHYFQRIINAKQTYYELEKRELMVNDPRCRVGRSQQEREALADVQLRGQIEEIIELKQATHDLETMMVSIKSKRTDLKDAQGRMRDQMKLIEHDIGMGARWGNHAPSAEFNETADEIDGMLKAVDRDFGIDPDEDEEEDEEEDEIEEEEGEVEVEEKTVEIEPQPEPPKPQRSRKPKAASKAKEPEPELDAPSSGVLDFLGNVLEEPPKARPPIEQPVLTFGDELVTATAREEEGNLDKSPMGSDLFGINGDGVETLPPAEHAQGDADDFLEGLDPEAGETAPDEVGADEVGIDDLIASFADD
jgi:hypothetical protein